MCCHCKRLIFGKLDLGQQLLYCYSDQRVAAFIVHASSTNINELSEVCQIPVPSLLAQYSLRIEIAFAP